MLRLFCTYHFGGDHIGGNQVASLFRVLVKLLPIELGKRDTTLGRQEDRIFGEAVFGKVVADVNIDFTTIQLDGNTSTS